MAGTFSLELLALIMTVLCFQERGEEGTVYSVTAELLGSGLHS